MKRFNIRVYGILVNESGEVLISTERRKGHTFTKFPGGGLEFGEGTKDCLARELKEELNVDAEIGELVYLTDFFQQSAFHPDHQLISIYYRAFVSDWMSITVSLLAHGHHDEETFRWIPLNELTEEVMTFPIDKKVAQKIKDGV